jgi:hypothetical protein
MRAYCDAMSRVRVQNYRCYAGDCLDLAGKVANQRDRHLLIEMASGWHELASALETYMDEHDGQEPPFDLGPLLGRKTRDRHE